MFVCQILVILFSNNYRGILRRKKFDEWIAILKYTINKASAETLYRISRSLGCTMEDLLEK